MQPLARNAFRPHPLDGAMLYFHPGTGVHVRVETEATRACSRRAPRVVMFGITNACNLRCDFCSRDLTRASSWTVDSAATVLEGLADAGTLEVAFGGGEPFAFRGFEALLARLHASTRLALHVTTNGTLLDPAVLARLSGVLGQVRLSIYEEVPWRRAAHALERAGQTWGANVLVDDEVLPRLPGLLSGLAALGARDVSLLSYVGPDPARALTAKGEDLLSAIVRASPLPCRVSVCFGARLQVPRLFTGMGDDGDCGAGLDFLALMPDKAVQSCSFQDVSFPIESSKDVLDAWRARRDALRRASPRPGCARSDRHPDRPSARGLRVWQSFSGNNSGECILVSKFECSEDAGALLAELIPGYVPGDPYSAPWRELFQREGVDRDSAEHTAPDEMVAVGRAFIARTDFAPGDEFPELRALTWRRGGEVIAGGVHVHGDTTALAVVRARDSTDARTILGGALAAGGVGVAHGLDVIVALCGSAMRDGTKRPYTPLAWQKSTLGAIAAARPFAMELVFEAVDEGALATATKRLGAPATPRPRLLLSVWGEEDATLAERARELAAELEGSVTPVRNLVLVENVARRHRLAIHGYRRSASIAALGGEIVEVYVQLWRAPAPRTKGRKAPAPVPLDVGIIDGELRSRLRRELGPKEFHMEECVAETWGGRVRARVRTSAPAEVLTTCSAYAESAELKVWLGVSDVDPLERAIRRLQRDVAEIERAAR